VRFNPKTVWVNVDSEAVKEDRPLFDVPDLQQMADPMEFIRKTQANYPELDIDELTDAFKEVEAELRRQAEEPNNKNHED
jgi:exonuclease SbcD